MPYRAQEEALRHRARVLRSEVDQLLETETTLLEELEAERALESRARERLAEAGPGGGLVGSARRDRIDVAALVLVAIAVPLLYFQIVWHGYIVRDATVIPAILWVVTPALLAVIVAWPYRARSAGCSFAVILGTALCTVPFISIFMASR